MSAFLSCISPETNSCLQDNRKLLNESTEMHRKYTKMKESTASLKDENSALSTGLHSLNDVSVQLIDFKIELRRISLGKNTHFHLNVPVMSFNISHRLQEKTRFMLKQSEHEDIISDLKSSMASLSADRERFFQEKLDLTQKIQTLIHDLEQTRKVRHLQYLKGIIYGYSLMSIVYATLVHFYLLFAEQAVN